MKETVFNPLSAVYRNIICLCIFPFRLFGKLVISGLESETVQYKWSCDLGNLFVMLI